MDTNNLLVATRMETGVLELTLNNPPLNLVTLELTQQMIKMFKEIEADDTIRVVVITGTDDKAFCAGSDIKEFPKVRDQVIDKKLKSENEALNRLAFLSKPVIAAIEGVAIGGGCELSLTCDIRIMSENSQIALPEIKLGVVPGSGGLFRLPQLIGPAKALELMYTGKFITAEEAYHIGLVNRVVPTGQALSSALELAKEIAKQPYEAIKAIKKGVRESSRLSHDENLQLTLELSDHVFNTEDCVEGVNAFFEKREPRFKGVR